MILTGIATAQKPSFKILVVASADPDHDPMIMKAEGFLKKMGAENNFDVFYTRDATLINDENLAQYQVFVQMHLAPFDMTPDQQAALQHFISQGKGWVGVHAAGLTGTQFKGTSVPYWMWFEKLMGDIIYSPHPKKQTGKILVEDRTHPVTKNLPPSFSFYDEWYEFNRSPRPNVHVLATADETSYKQEIPMGDHPMIWINPHYDRAVYIGIGHDTTACTDPNFTILMRDAILWAASPVPDKAQSDLDKSLQQKITILASQVAYNLDAPKMAVIKSSEPLPASVSFEIDDALSLEKVWSGTISKGEKVKEWSPDLFYSQADFSTFRIPGNYKIVVRFEGKEYSSYDFKISEDAIGKTAIPAIINFFYHQRASSPQELEADKSILLYGSNKTVDLHGGWADASGDISKYFSHLAYTNFMLPQQTPMVTWSMANTVETTTSMLNTINARDALVTEALYGADYIMRSLSPEGYFYMTVFTYFDKDPKARRVVGLLADSKTTSDYQCAFREGGGMAIAALARVSAWNRNGDFTSKEYLNSAERAFAHLLVNSLKYADDHKNNVIDDYCALMAASELWIATGKNIYRDEARKRSGNLAKRMTVNGYFLANDSDRPFWHAADAGLPVIALARYLDKESDKKYRELALETIRKALDYNLKITGEVPNPFGYPRQSFLYKGKVQNGFFIPHENESGWWWQGEDARLGSLAAAAIVGGRLVYPGTAAFGVKKDLADYASHLVSWILGCNPYNICMMYGYGQNNVPYMAAMYGHGSGRGGISNGITGKDGNGDGSGIDFKMEDNGNEWRWSEQWIPHTGWFLQAVAAMSSDNNVKKPEFRVLVLTERGGQHEGFVVAALDWISKKAEEKNFEITVINNANDINEAMLSQYKVIIQLDYPPYTWNETAMAAFVKYIEEGRGGWVGFHHATLLGEFDGYPMWNWFSHFMGGVRFENYVAATASGKVNVEDNKHPVMKGVSPSFIIDGDEWYTYNKSPRPNVHVLASVDESTYKPATDIKMGDHPVVWVNENKKAKNVYILMGHDGVLLKNNDFTTMFSNAIMWTAGKME
ncbi:MAG: ThuA domain-containing protein [Bacteroidales bacterium]|nr:ThuA domain-containing protein [Bacteroidales bacterium]